MGGREREREGGTNARAPHPPRSACPPRPRGGIWLLTQLRGWPGQATPGPRVPRGRAFQPRFTRRAFFPFLSPPLPPRARLHPNSLVCVGRAHDGDLPLKQGVVDEAGGEALHRLFGQLCAGKRGEGRARAGRGQRATWEWTAGARVFRVSDAGGAARFWLSFSLSPFSCLRSSREAWSVMGEERTRRPGCEIERETRAQKTKRARPRSRSTRPRSRSTRGVERQHRRRKGRA